MGTCVDGKPRVSCSREEQKVTRLCKVIHEITKGLARCIGALDNCIWVNPVHSCGATVGTEHILDVGPCPLHVPIDIHREPWSFRDGEPEIKSDGARNTTQANENTSAVVYVLEVVEAVRKDGVSIGMDCY